MLKQDSKIYVSGHRGLVGRAVVNELRNQGFHNLILATRDELDLTNQRAVFDFFATHRPECQVIAASLVGGISANNDFPGEFIGQNLMIQTNLLEAARRYTCKGNLFIASSCIYPRDALQPLKEEYLLTGPLEHTNEFYAVAKLAGIKLAQGYGRQYKLDCTSILPTNLYGPYDNFHLTRSHVLPALLRKIHEAKEGQSKKVKVWGTGKVKREFLHTQDLAKAIVFLLCQKNKPELLNIGYGKDITIHQLAILLKKIIGFSGDIEFDTNYPDGTPRKILDSSRIRQLGWQPTISLEEGITSTYQWFIENKDNIRI